MTETVTLDERDPSEPKPKPPIEIEFEWELRVEQKVDVVAYFAGFSLSEQKAYWHEDLSDYVGEWERPLAYMVEAAVPEAQAAHMRGATTREWVDCDLDFNRETIHRAGERGHGDTKGWSEDDYRGLLEHVPWMNQSEMSTEDKARLPGPNDVPLFEE